MSDGKKVGFCIGELRLFPDLEEVLYYRWRDLILRPVSVSEWKTGGRLVVEFEPVDSYGRPLSET